MDEETRQALDFLRAKVRSIEMGMVVQKNQILVTTNTHVAGTLTADNLVGVVAPGMVSHADLTNILPNDHHNQAHDFMGADHSVSGSAGWVVGYASPVALGMYETSSAPGAASKLLKTDAAGGIEIQALSVFGNITSRHLMPEATDTYDLGSSTALWRKGWLSELDAVLFAKNTRALVGGWLTIGKGEGALAAAAAAADTAMDFGQAMTTGQFVELRTSLAVEYVQVGSLASGTTYNVTRNLDGSGANDWPMGAVYLIRGVSGDGMIDLNAYDSPRMSVIRQGATYNAQTETLRFGDLNGGWGFSAETWGAALGAYASGSPNVIITAGKVALRNYNTEVISLSGSSASFEAPISLGLGGGVYQGTGTFASPTTGIKWWNDSGIGRIASYTSGSAQVYFGTDGKMYAASGGVRLDANGISLAESGTTNLVKTIKFFTDTNFTTSFAHLRAAYNSSTNYSSAILAANKDAISGDTYVTLNGLVGLTSKGSRGSCDFYMNASSLANNDTWWNMELFHGSNYVYLNAYCRDAETIVNLYGSYSASKFYVTMGGGTIMQTGLAVGNSGAVPSSPAIGNLYLEKAILKSIAVCARVIRTSQYTLTSGTSWDVVWTNRTNTYNHSTEIDDTPYYLIGGYSAMWDGATALYCRVDGWYVAEASVAFWQNGVATRNYVSIHMNGTGVYLGQNEVHNIAAQNCIISATTGIFYMHAGDYVQCLIGQGSGSNKTCCGSTQQYQHYASFSLWRVA